MFFKRCYSFDSTVKNLIKSGQFEVDKPLERVIIYLNKLSVDLESRNRTWFPTDAKKGAYIYGSVGSGKTMLMNLFYENVNVDRKFRFHFNQFMLKFHSDLRKLRDEGVEDPMKDLIGQRCKEINLLCLDEFQVKVLI